MKIAFYAPLKSPSHPVPSGDRLMARLLIEAMRHAGHIVFAASELRSFTAAADDPADADIRAAALEEIERLSALWQAQGAPDVWFAYHPYYKTPDLIGPALCRRFGLAYVTAEASYSRRRNLGQWARAQAEVLEAVRLAAVNFCFTARDRQGLEQVAPEARFAALAPFLDTAPFAAVTPHPRPGQLIAVAMMRPGDKMASFSMLADALDRIADEDWTLSIVGDGKMRGELERRFAGFGPERIRFQGERSADEIVSLLGDSALYVWPGCGEAYGLAYLEAQAAGLPVVAQATGGVPEVVRAGVTGLLTPEGDVAAYAAAVRRLLRDDALRREMAGAARAFVLGERSLDRASGVIDDYLGKAMAGQ